MLEVTSAAKEASLKIDFTDVYKNSELHRLDSLVAPLSFITYYQNSKYLAGNKQ